MLEIIVVYIYYIIDFDQHPGGDASRVLGHVSWKRTWPHFRSSLGEAYSFFFTLWGNSDCTIPRWSSSACRCTCWASTRVLEVQN